MKTKKGASEIAKKIKMIIFDVDGTLTDGCIYMGPEGEAMKAFSARDGLCSFIAVCATCHNFFICALYLGDFSSFGSSFGSNRKKNTTKTEKTSIISTATIYIILA